MNCRIIEMRNREVISLKDGARLGAVCDVEIDTCSGQLASIIIYGKPKLFGLLGREPDLVIPWEEIEVFGDETILVSSELPRSQRRRQRGETKIFS